VIVASITVYGVLTTMLVAVAVMYLGWVVENREGLNRAPGWLGYTLGGIVLVTGILWQLHI
jgi:hypothetical protein